MPRALSAVFREALGEGADGVADETLESDLRRALADARTAWPEIDVPQDVFVGQLGRCVSADPERPVDLTTLQLGDVYLACACAAGNARAITAFEATYLQDAEGNLARRGFTVEVIDETKQELRQRLFGAPEGVPSRLLEYRGRGELRAWLRVVATRAALKIVRREQRPAPAIDNALLGAPSDKADPEISYMKQLYAPAFKEAVAEAFDALSDREKNVLRHLVLDGLTAERIGALYGVHRVTAATWISNARRDLTADTKRLLKVRFGFSDSDYVSVARLVESEMDITLGSVLRPDA